MDNNESTSFSLMNGRGNFVVREIALSEIERILPLIAGQNPNLTDSQLRDRLAEMLSHGYRCIGAFLDDELVGVAGFWVGCRFWCGRYIDADNVIVSEPFRNQGIGWRLMDWIHEEGERLNCDVAVLDSYVTFTDAHRFYERMGYERLGWHFKKKL